MISNSDASGCTTSDPAVVSSVLMSREVKEFLADAALNEILARGAPILGIFFDNTISLLEFIWSHIFTGTLDHFLKTTKISDWMAHVPNNTKLIHMNLPGTHDTCTCKFIIPCPRS